jgi:hypothetical protein
MSLEVRSEGVTLESAEDCIHLLFEYLIALCMFLIAPDEVLAELQAVHAC